MQLRLAPLPTVLLFSIFSLVQATNFTFTFGNPTQCGNLPVSWTGGSPPFELMLIPEFGTPRTFNVPQESFSNGKGSYQVQVPFPQGKKFLLSMSDVSGLGSGGVSDELVAGPPVGNANCNTTDPGVDFFFDLNTALQQCRPYTFSAYDQAVQPVTIWALIPGGTTFILNPPVGPTSFDWIADVAFGSSLLFIMTDSQGHKGGSSDVKLVGNSDDSSCVNAQSPMSLSNSPHQTSSTFSTSSTGTSSTLSASNTAAPVNGNVEKKSNTGAIVGGILAGLFAIFAIGVLGVFLWHRRRRSDSYGSGTGLRTYGGPRRERRISSMDLDPPSTMGASTAAVIQPYPYVAPGVLASATGGGVVSINPSPSAQSLLSQQAQEVAYESSRYSTLHDPYSPAASSSGAAQTMARHIRQGSMESGQVSSSGGAPTTTMSTAMQRKAAMAGVPGYRPRPRYIVHTDLEEVEPTEEGEVIELPPQYSERRAPIPGLVPPHGLDYAVPPPEMLPPNPLELDQGESSLQLPRPIEPGPPTPTSARRPAASS